MVLAPLSRPAKVLAGVPVYFSPGLVPPGKTYAVRNVPGTGRTGLVLYMHGRADLDRALRYEALRAEGRGIARRIVERGFRAMGVATAHEHAALREAGVPPTTANLARLRAGGIAGQHPAAERTRRALTALGLDPGLADLFAGRAQQ